MIRRSAVSLALVAVMTMSTGRLFAQGTPPSSAPSADQKAADAKEAELRFVRARQLFDEGDYQLALVEFKRAYDLSPNYRVLFNIAQIHMQLLNYAGARTALEKFLQDGGDDVPPARKAQAQADLQMLKQRTAFLTLKTTPSAEVTIDEQPVGSSPFAAPLLVNAGQRKIVVSRLGYVLFAKVLTFAGGDNQDLAVELTPVPQDGRSEGPKLLTTTSKNYVPAAVAWAATGVLGIGTAVFGGLYLTKESELKDRSDPRENNLSAQTKKELEASATRLAVTADVFGLLTIGAAAVAVYYTARPPKTETITTATIRIMPTPNGLMGTF